MIKKEEEIRNLEETILRIKNKQAKLFEKRLDAFLALEDETLSQQERRMVFNSILAGDSFIPNQEDDPNILITSERRENDEENDPTSTGTNPGKEV